MRTVIDINPNMLTWAISRAGYELQDFIEKHPLVHNWLEGIKKPTVKQLEKFSNWVHIPFGYLFLNAPPKEDIPFPFFRTGKDQVDKVSLNVFDTIQILQRRQDWLTDYLIEKDMDKISFVGKYNENTEYCIIVKDIRKTLGLTEEWASEFQTFEETLIFITKKLKKLV